METLLFTNVKLYDGTGRAPFMADVAVQDEKIAAVAECGTLKQTGCTVIDGKGLALTPGFIDVHTHGRSGYEFTDGVLEHLNTMCVDKLSEGVTSWLPTTLTLGYDALAAALENARKYNASGVPGAKIPGVHLEGPYINPKCLGAQNPAFVRTPDIEEVRKLNEICRVLKVSVRSGSSGTRSPAG